MAIHRTETAATIRIAVDGETIVATGIHRFWKAGKGWTMARDLKAGDRLRMPGSLVEVRVGRRGQDQAVYNLDVAENGDFFVGRQGVLVHDSNFVKPVARTVRFPTRPDRAQTWRRGRRHAEPFGRPRRGPASSGSPAGLSRRPEPLAARANIDPVFAEKLQAPPG